MPRLLTASLVAVFALFVLFGLGLAQWQYLGDPPLLNYAAWLMVEKGAMPYRDFFETSMPGTFIVHGAVVALGLDANVPFIALGLALYAGLSLAGARILSRADIPSGLIFALLYMAVMLSFGAEALFQRELIGTAAVAAAIVIGLRGPHMIALGILFGLAALIKPQLAFTAPIVALATCGLHRAPLLRSIAASLLGFAAPLVATGLWLWTNDALPQFMALVQDYLPLHIQQTTYHVFLEPTDRMKYLGKEAARFGGFWVLVAGPALLTLLQWIKRAEVSRTQHIILGMLTVIAAAYSLIPILAGQFWNYHYFPFIFFAALCACACLLFSSAQFSTSIRTIAVLGAFGVPLIQTALLFDPQLVAKNNRDMKVIAKMETALDRWLPEGGRVQPIDWTKGAIHAMLRAQADLATPFFYDYHFHHHQGSETIAGLRARFLTDLSRAAPEVILVVPTRPMMKGLDVNNDWPALERYISENYRIVESAEDHVVHLRNDLEPVAAIKP